MMKKQFKKIAAFIAVGILIVCAVFICACTESEVDPLPPEPPPEEQPIQTEYAEGELVIIEDGTTKIEDMAFENNEKIRKVVMPNSVIEIDDYAFYDCTNLEEVVFSKNLKKICDFAFGSCGKLKSLELPQSLEYLGRWTFSYCSKLQSISIPPSVTHISERAFYSCRELQSITLPDTLTNLDYAAFEDCSALIEIALPDSLKRIPTKAFGGCTKLEKISLPKNLESIGTSAFCNCQSLKEIDIPDSVKYIGDNSFGLYEDAYDSVFAGCRFTSLRLPENAKLNGFGLMRNSLIRNLTLPKCCPLYKEMFKGCAVLREVILPKYITSFDEDVFKDLYLTNLYYPGTKEEWRQLGIDEIYDKYDAVPIHFYSEEEPKTNGNFWHYVTDDNGDVFAQYWQLDYSKYLSNDGTLTIPDGIVYLINDDLIHPWKNARKVIMPDSVKAVDFRYFREWENLEEVVLSKNLTKINENTFSGCKKLRKISIPNGVTKIGGSAFSGCTSLTEIIFPYSVTEIGDHGFYDCKNLKSVVFSSNLKTIGRGAFAYTALQKVTLPDSVKTIDGELPPMGLSRPETSGAFAHCTNLTELIIPKNTVLKNYDIFVGCTSLKKLVLPNYAPVVNSMFDSCTSLSEIVLPKILSDYEPNAFKNCPLKTVYYPGSQDEWREWNITEITGSLGAAKLCFYSKEQPLVQGDFWHYVDGVPTMWS